MKNELLYFQFPLFLMRGLFTDKEKTLNDIISYGIYRFSKRIEYNLSDAAKQSMYGYYRKPITSNLEISIQSYVDNDLLSLDEDYNGFSGTEFNPEYEVEQLLELFEKDNNFKEQAIEFYQIKKAFEKLGIEKGTYDHCLQVGKRIEKTIPEKEPFPQVNKSLIFEFRDNEKSEFDLIQLAAYISIRSILGKSSYGRTNKAMIISRAFGYSSTKHLPENMEPIIRELFVKYSYRYQIDKVLDFLELKWNILKYSTKMKGMYIGLKNKITIDQLVLFAESKKLKNQMENLKRQKNEAREKALQQLNKEQHLNK